ncbi:MAG: 3-dehydroquinate synthase [Actinobacteria bacterium]|nr:3-dehydroquinate synthase [Actinomycetota bacterium]
MITENGSCGVKGAVLDIKHVRVELGKRSYTVLVGSEIMNEIPFLLGERGWRKAAIVTDSNVGPLYLEKVERTLSRAGIEIGSVMVEAGEDSKSMEEAIRILNYLSSREMTRGDLVIGLGGGVVGDLAGFAASIFKRGLDLLQVPTTLMSQADSSIGGKTGVNLPSGKNLVGTFYQPLAVIADVEMLKTLKTREFKSGLAEVAKYRFLKPDGWPGTLPEFEEALKEKDAFLVEMVSRCAGIKAEVVSRDEWDTGLRAVLNYGHTLGHALETVTGYTGTYTHGEAVSVGMVFAALVSRELGITEDDLVNEHQELLSSAGLPIAPFDPSPEFDKLFEIMLQDKKSRGSLAMVLLEKDGKPLVERGLGRETLWKCYRELIRGE